MLAIACIDTTGILSPLPYAAVQHDALLAAAVVAVPQGSLLQARRLEHVLAAGYCL